MLVNLLTLPTECILQISENLPLITYHSLRRTSQTLFRILPKLATLTFEAYMTSVDQETVGGIGRRIMMKLKTDELDSNSFLFMARNLHSTEFLRLLNCRNNHVLDTYSRTEAFKIIVESRFNCSESETMLLELLKYDVDPSVKIIRYNNVIVWAAERGLVDLFKVLLNDPRIDVNAQDEYGDLAIHKAVLEGHLPILKLILDDGGIDPNVVGYASRNVIHCAATRNQHSILKYLRANTNVDPALADINGDHAIHSAAYCNAEESIEILLDDPDVDLLARDSTGWTIVQLLVAYEKWDLVKRVGGDVFHSWA